MGRWAALLGLWMVVSAPAQGEDFESAFVTAPGTFPSSHGSTLAELSDGTLFTCWFAGSREAGRDVEIVCSRKPSDGPWEAPETVVAAGEAARGSVLRNKFVGNPTLVSADDGYLWLFYEAVQWGGHSGAYIDYKVSPDGGRSWTPSRRLVGHFGNFGHLPRNKALPRGDHRYWLPVYREFLSHYGYVFELELVRGEILSQSTQRIPGTGHIQPTLVPLDRGDVLALLRNTRGRRVLSSVWERGPEQWSQVTELELPHPNSALDAERDAHGRVVLAYNHSETSRSPLSLAVSEDGIRYRRIFDLESGKVSYSYPALIRGSEGDFHLTYTYNRDTIKYVRFTQSWLDRAAADAPGGVSP